jgi:hypothetical protein
MTVSGRFAVGTFGEYVFGSGTTFGIDVNIDVVTTITDEVTVTYAFNLIINAVTSDTFSISNTTR